jgi:hypothetical protein
MSDLNVDDFFHDAASALIALYQVFPRRKAIFVDDIIDPEEPDDFGMYSDRFLACYSTLLWLGEEDFLRFEESINQEAIDQAVLSGRCFTLLSSPALDSREPTDADLPDSVREERASNLFAIRQALKEGSSAAVRTAMLNLLRQMNQLVERDLSAARTGSG